MDPLEIDDDAVRVSPSLRPVWLFAVLIICAQIVVSLVSYPFMPASVPSHWNVAGGVNGYMPRLVYAIFCPGLSLGLYLLMRWLIAAGPKVGNANQVATRWVVDRTFTAVLVLLLAMQLATVAIVLHVPVNMTFTILVSISLLFIYLGNYMGKLRRNFWAGIRTPWTIASDVVWERTHRLAGWLFVAVGLLGLLLAFIPIRQVQVFGWVGSLVAIILVLFVYSYVVYRRNEKRGELPLSPPFDGGH